MTEDEMVEWHHRLDGHEFEYTPGVDDGQGGSTPSPNRALRMAQPRCESMAELVQLCFLKNKSQTCIIL